MRVYTDGSSYWKTREGGYAFFRPDTGHFGHGHVEDTTSSRMEMMAVLMAMRYFGVTKKMTICSDSSYVVNCWKQKWYLKWDRVGWVKGDGEPVMNQDLWKPMVEIWRANRKIRVIHVKGHIGIPGNEMADMLAKKARTEQIKHTTGVMRGWSIST